MAFDRENTLHIVSGIGTSGVPLMVRRSVTTIASLQKKTKATSNVSVYPNPAQTYINLTGELADKQILMTDITGKILLSEDANGNTFQIETSRLTNGIYFITITGINSRETIRVSINK